MVAVPGEKVSYFTLEHAAPTAEAFRAVLEAEGLRVLSVTPVKALLDHSKPLLDTEEMAYLLGVNPGTLSQIKAKGELPFTMVNGRVVYERRLVEFHLASNRNPAARQLEASAR